MVRHIEKNQSVVREAWGLPLVRFSERWLRNLCELASMKLVPLLRISANPALVTKLGSSIGAQNRQQSTPPPPIHSISIASSPHRKHPHQYNLHRLRRPLCITSPQVLSSAALRRRLAGPDLDPVPSRHTPFGAGKGTIM